jgi:hypothetical protein
VAAYVTAHQRSSTRWFLLAWFVLGLAALARPTALVVFPALALHLWLSRPPAQAARQSAALLAMAALVLGPWLLRHYILYGDLNVMGSSALSHFWLGAIRDGQWGGLADFVEQRATLQADDPNNPPYLRAALQVIAENPIRFAGLVARKLLRAYLQPAGTTFFAGPSLKEMLAAVLAGRGSLAALVGDATFWPKLLIYIWHFGTLGLGLAAMWAGRSRWRETLPPVLVIAAMSGLYALLTIIPRYIFPTMPFYAVFAAQAIVALWGLSAGLFSKPGALRAGQRAAPREDRQLL